MNFIVYILYSASINKYYVGYTDNIERRLNEHNTGQTRYTSNTGSPWMLVYTEKYDSRTLAMKRAKEIKSKKSRKYIESLIRLERPDIIGKVEGSSPSRYKSNPPPMVDFCFLLSMQKVESFLRS